MNATGAAIGTPNRSGGNPFKGLEHISYEPGSFVGSNAAPADMSARGYTCPPNSSGTPQCANPNLLFWEVHGDIGGPLKRDKGWLYGAPNHFKTCPVGSGVDHSGPDEIGSFDKLPGPHAR